MALPLSGLLAQHLGWEWIFYVFGVIGLLWCISWFWVSGHPKNTLLYLFVRYEPCFYKYKFFQVVMDNPEQDRKITDQELEYLRTSIGTIVHFNFHKKEFT